MLRLAYFEDLRGEYEIVYENCKDKRLFSYLSTLLIKWQVPKDIILCNTIQQNREILKNILNIKNTIRVISQIEPRICENNTQ